MNYLKAQEIFENFVNSGETIYTEDKTETLEIADGEEWRMCYSPSHKIRRLFPQNWVLSNRGNLVSVSKKKVRLIKKCFNGGRYASHYFTIHTDTGGSKHKRIALHNLIAIVFNADAYGKAANLLDKYGLEAFGSFGSADESSDNASINGHHKTRVSVDNNTPENIRLLTTAAHRLERIPKNPQDIEKLVDYMERLSQVAAGESPNAITLVSTGQRLGKSSNLVLNDTGYRDIESVDRITLSVDAYKSLCKLYYKAVGSWIVDSVVKQLVKKYGAGYFADSRYFYCSVDSSFYRVDNQLRIIEEPDIMELAGKDFITCYLNDKREAECFVEGYND